MIALVSEKIFRDKIIIETVFSKNLKIFLKSL